MKVTVAVISRDKEFCEYVQQRQRQALSEDSLRRVGEPKLLNVVVLSIRDHEALKQLDFERRLEGASEGAHAFLVLIERGCLPRMSSLSSAPLSYIFDRPPSNTGAFQNFCHQAFSKLTKAYSHIRGIEEQKIVRLPLRNFDGDDLRELARLCRENVGNADFLNSFDRQMKSLRRRLLPRRDSKDQSKYMFDDQKRHFQYGKERHARYPTGAPHLPSCNVTGRFRFGCAVDADRHFNVSTGEGDHTEIEGQFWDCHNQLITVSTTSHLNMFCNDYF
jgi:hypothetical protein